MSNVLAQDTEVVTKAKRRTFTAKYKREIISQAAQCQKPGELGELLRRNGLYSSHLSDWRRELEQRGLAGLAPRKRGPKVTPPTAAEIENRRLRGENAILTVRAERAEMLVEIQKKLSTLLGLEMPKCDENV
jgi:transposase-like protein